MLLFTSSACFYLGQQPEEGIVINVAFKISQDFTTQRWLELPPAQLEKANGGLHTLVSRYGASCETTRAGHIGTRKGICTWAGWMYFLGWVNKQLPGEKIRQDCMGMAKTAPKANVKS